MFASGIARVNTGLFIIMVIVSLVPELKFVIVSSFDPSKVIAAGSRSGASNQTAEPDRC
jgi:hypothetical protein